MLRRPARLATVLAALATLVTLAAPLTAMPADAGDDRAVGRPVVAKRLVVVDHNVERRSDVVDLAVAWAKATGAQLIALQEVCWWQARELVLENPTWTLSWRRDTDTTRCRTWDPDLAVYGDRLDSGTVAIRTGPAYGSAAVFDHQLARQARGMSCVHWTERGVRSHLCSVHLTNLGRRTDNVSRAVQLNQARQVRAVAEQWTRLGHLVVVAGDFNARPGGPTLGQMYGTRGQGPFVEATSCRPRARGCHRTGLATLDGSDAKLDYVFFSANRLLDREPHALTVRPTASDHHLLRGWGWVDLG